MNSSKLMYILVGVIVLAVFFTFVLILRNVGGGGNQPVTLTFWGVFDDHRAFDRAIADFRSQNPDVDVKYQQVPYAEYETSLVNALAAGTGPDMVMVHNTWLPKHGDKLGAMPGDIPDKKKPLTVQDFKAQFVDVVGEDLIFQNRIYGLPLYVDSLAVYYNKDLLNAAGITAPPRTWEEVNDDVALLSKFDGRGNLVQSGIALGTARNINRSTDILMDMMLQSGVRMTDDEKQSAAFAAPVNGQHAGEVALQYYADFADPRKQTYSWNDSQHYSIDAFTEGTLAMMVGYGHQLPVIRSKAPRLNFSVAPMPQASTTDIHNFANYWAVGVAGRSAHPVEAWKFAAYLTSKEGAASYLNAVGRPAARRDLIDIQRTDPDLGVFAVQALTARSWYQVDSAAIEGIFADMIDDVNFSRASVRDALSQAASRVTVLMQNHR